MNPKLGPSVSHDTPQTLLPDVPVGGSVEDFCRAISDWISKQHHDPTELDFGIPHISASFVKGALAARKADNYVSIQGNKPGQSEKRPISIPPSEIMYLQRELLRALPHGLIHPAAFAYRPKTSAIECVRTHVGMRWGVKLDLSSFFHQIRTSNVQTLFEFLGLSKLAATTYAELFTRLPNAMSGLGQFYGDGFLPQGAPTSGALSNLVCMQLDEALAAIASSRSLTYTRYSDDLFFSSTEDNFSKLHALRLVRQVRESINGFGMTLNKNKTRIYSPHASFQYLGLLIGSDGIRLPRHYRDELKNTDYAIGKVGLGQVEAEYQQGNRAFRAHTKKTAVSAQFFITRYIGQLLYARQVDSELAKGFAQSLNIYILDDSNTWANVYDDWTRKFVTTSLQNLLTK